MPQADERFDIVYSWSTVHYVADPLGLLVSFTKYQPAVILIVASPFGPHAFVRAQVGPGTHVPHWVINMPDAENRMRESGYRLALCAVDEQTYNVVNFDPQHRIGSNAILLFTRARPSRL